MGRRSFGASHGHGPLAWLCGLAVAAACVAAMPARAWATAGGGEGSSAQDGGSSVAGGEGLYLVAQDTGSATTSLSGAIIGISKSSYPYTGSAVVPSVTVRLSGRTLTAGNDYTVSYANNVNVGTATITVTGNGGYTGSASRTFAITALSLAQATVTLPATSYVYSGSAFEPTPTVRLSGKLLNQGSDYQVAYWNNISAGRATVVIRGVGNYSREVYVPFEIKVASMAQAVITLPAKSYSYTGDPILPIPTVTCSGRKLIQALDYEYSFANNTSVGTATVTVTGKGNYEGTASMQFKIERASISKAGISLPVSRCTYTGSSQTPVPTVRLVGKVLREGTDYTVSYKNNVAVGTATVTVSGKGSYKDSVSKTFNVVAASIASASVTLPKTNYVYSGAAFEPAPTVTFSGKTLSKGSDYAVSYKGNVSAGTATVTVTGKGNYVGSASATFGIAPTSLAKAVVSLPKTGYPYAGRGIEPLPTVTLSGKALQRNRDYALSYKNNVAIGTATVTVTGKGNYKGAVSKTFAIEIASLAGATVSVPQSNYTYTGAAIRPIPTVRVEGRLLVAGTDYKVTYGANVHRGPGSVSVSGMGNYTGSKSVLFRIDPTSIAPAQVTLPQSSYTFTGSAVTPVPTVVYGKKKLVSGTDYAVSYRGNTNAGTATVTVTGKGNYGGTASKTFSIVPFSLANAKMTLPQASYAYTGAAIKPTPTVKHSDGKLVFRTNFAITYKNNTNVGTATITVTGVGNYSGTLSKTFSITPASLSSAKVTLPKVRYAYTGKAIKPVPTIRLGTSTVAAANYVVAYKNNTKRGTATVTVTGKGNYAGTVTATFKIA